MHAPQGTLRELLQRSAAAVIADVGPHALALALSCGHVAVAECLLDAGIRCVLHSRDSVACLISLRGLAVGGARRRRVAPSMVTRSIAHAHVHARSSGCLTTPHPLPSSPCLFVCVNRLPANEQAAVLTTFSYAIRCNKADLLAAAINACHRVPAGALPAAGLHVPAGVGGMATSDATAAGASSSETRAPGPAGMRNRQPAACMP